MSHHWLLITFSWIGTASLQYINTGDPGADTILDPFTSYLRYPLPYLNQPPISESFQSDQLDYLSEQVQRKRRTADDKEARSWMPNLLDTGETLIIRDLMNNEAQIPSAYDDDNKTEIEKRNFSPWGGKRSGSTANVEHTWTWKRASGIREPSMPKRVRFSPWGGKRSGQMIYKAPGSKSTKVIYSTSIPELTKVISNYSPTVKQLHLAGFQVIPGMDMSHPIKVLALGTHLDEQTLRDALPFKMFLDSLPKNFKPGHPYTDVHLKRDGKRKVKFSTWGGKRSPPIIGPIWTPASQNQQDSTLNTILLIRNSPDIAGKDAF
ncbi:Leucokinin [Operophtera brumata]|uniref:Leucokinin n=1 Tax=Operophtera brumata TaxID=104452 RepID=A0A0L7LHQ0_OPEBR|nr:Leucokinin [Operophtera brumata]